MFYVTILTNLKRTVTITVRITRPIGSTWKGLF